MMIDMIIMVTIVNDEDEDDHGYDDHDHRGS